MSKGNRYGHRNGRGRVPVFLKHLRQHGPKGCRCRRARRPASFFQLYIDGKDDGFNAYLVKKKAVRRQASKPLSSSLWIRPWAATVKRTYAITLQFPLPMPNLAAYSSQDGVGKGIAEIYAAAKADFVPSDIDKIKTLSGLPVLVKGIQSPEDAEAAIKAGADGIWVSNHGGRQLRGVFGGAQIRGQNQTSPLDATTIANHIRCSLPHSVVRDCQTRKLVEELDKVPREVQADRLIWGKAGFYILKKQNERITEQKKELQEQSIQYVGLLEDCRNQRR